MKVLRLVTVVLFLFTYCLKLNAKVFDYVAYEQQVLEHNQAFLGLKSDLENYQKKSNEQSLMVLPQIFANFSYSHDERETLNPQFMGIFTNARIYEWGIKQQTPWGQQYSLSYMARYVDLNGAALANATAYEVGPKLELTQSLWRNFFGSETRAQQGLIQKQNWYQYQQNVEKYRQFIQQIKISYLNYFIAQKMMALESSALENAQAIRDWAKRRSQKGLGDESDFLQAQAQVLQKQYELKAAQDNLTSAEKVFINMMGSEELDKKTELRPIDMQNYLKAETSLQYRPRANLESYRAQMEMAKNQSLLNRERYRPILEAYGQMMYQGREATYEAAKDEAMDKKYEWWAVGLRFSAPLFFWESANTTAAYAAQAENSEKYIQQKELEEIAEWQRKKDAYLSQREKFKLSQQLLEVQKKKIEVERKKLRQGRTTTYQVLMFELDYVNSQSLYWKSQLELLIAATDLEMYQ